MHRNIICFSHGLLFLLLSMVSAPLWALELGLPVRCEMDKSCFIQNYFDHDLSESHKDYRCGHLTYNKHTGTDFRVIDENAMKAGVPVLAAAPGRVLGVRDDEPDVAFSKRGQDQVAGKEAGNGVLIDHGDGWQTQYSHLLKGSLRVKPGERVERGQIIGLIGESGKADFPHVDFTVRKDGRPVDPFWPNGIWACGLRNAPAWLWADSARASLAYIDTVVLQVGFAERIPSRLEAQSGSWRVATLSSDQPQFVLWAEVMGAKAGDRWEIKIMSPAGQQFVSGTGEVSGNKAIIVVGAGKGLKSGQWPVGTYEGVFELRRGEQMVAQQRASLLIQ